MMIGMEQYHDLIERFVKLNKLILGDNLVGIYLHGSAAMGCLNAKLSDIDLIIIVKNDLLPETKRKYMDMVVELNKEAPAKGIELSVVKEAVCNPFVYPTPFELHFSIAHLKWYQSNPDDYIEKMKGTDKDLAAHFTVIRHRGKKLYGKEIRDVFAAVSKEDYFDSIWCDIENAGTDILQNPMYIILNLCRVLAFVKDNLILSKEEGGKWGLLNTPEKYRNLISTALEEYQNGAAMPLNETLAKEYKTKGTGSLAQLNQGTCPLGFMVLSEITREFRPDVSGFKGKQIIAPLGRPVAQFLYSERFRGFGIMMIRNLFSQAEIYLCLFRVWRCLDGCFPLKLALRHRH